MLNPALLSIAIPVLLSACSASGREFPSLAKRPIESRSDEIVAAPLSAAPAKAPISSASLGNIAAAVGRAEEAQSTFQAALGPAQSAVGAAKGTSFGSEGWVVAQMAVSALERARLPVKAALADIDREQRIVIEGTPDADLGQVTTAAARVDAIDRAQGRVLENLLVQLKSR
jgi:hypothetical protein